MPRASRARGTALLLALLAAPAGAQSQDYAALRRAASREPVLTARIVDTTIAEISGIAASRRADDLLWAINDGGNGNRLHALGADGAPRGSLTVAGAQNEDWEDLAAFTLDGAPWLLIADSGDNAGRRDELVLYLVPEPTLPLAADARVEVARELRVRFPDGPRDVEAVTVDAARGEVLLLAKRRVPAQLFRIALDPGPARVQVAELVAVAPRIPQPRGALGADDPPTWRYGGQVTAIDLAPDGRQLAVLTYRDAYLFRRGPDEPWSDALARAPLRMGLPRLVQAESLAYSRHGDALWVTSEKLPAPLLRIDLR